MGIDELLRHYPRLEGAEAKIRVRLDQKLLDRLCALLSDKFKGRLDGVRITPAGDNRFRIQAELSNWFLQLFGSLGMHALRENGIEVQIHFPSASRKSPTIQGSMDTTIFGRDIAIPKLVKAINDAVAQEVIEVVDSERISFNLFRVFVNLYPFRLLQRALPAAVADHFTRVRWQVPTDAFLFDFTWKHTGSLHSLATF